MAADDSENSSLSLRPYVGIFLCSAAVLMMEVLLTRVFSFTIWYHLAYLTISSVMIAFGASGSLLAAFPGLLRNPLRLSGIAGVLAGVSAILAIAYLGPRPIDPVILFEQPRTFFLGLLEYYVVLIVPFLLGGIAIAAPLTAYPRFINRLYAADLVGAAVGAGLAVASLTWTDGATAIWLCALLFMLGGVFYVGRTRLGYFLAAIVVVSAVGVPWANQVIKFETVGSKVLGMISAREDFVPIHTQWSPVNRVDVSENTTTFRGGFWTIGMRKLVPGPYPRVMSINYDGHNGSDIFEGGPEDMAFLDKHILRSPYIFLDQPEVLVIGMGGGIDVLNALRREARHVTAAELQPITIDVLQNQLADRTKETFLRDDVTLVGSEGRHFVQSNDAQYDLIQITATDTFSAQSAGAYVLAESYLYTVEAFSEYFDHLRPGGALCLVIGDIKYEDPNLPSPLGTRMMLTAREALERRGVTEPANNIIVVSPEPAPNMGMRTVLIARPQAFSPEEIARIRNFAEEANLILRVAPDGGTHPTMTALINEPRESLDALIAKQEFVLHPATDESPFFYHILRWSSVLTAGKSLWYFPGSATGQVMLLLMLAQAVVLGGLLIFLPLLIRRSAAAGSRRWAPRFLVYFLALGVGFMLIEISFVQKYVLLLGYPTYSLSVTIVSLLIFAAVGAALSRFGWNHPRVFLLGLLGTTIALVVAELLVLPSIREAMLGSPLLARIAVTVLLQCPLGICLGMYFPTGVELLRRHAPGWVAWAWAVNGIGSVASTVIAVILAMSIGFSGVAVVAMLIYVAGVLALYSLLTKSDSASSGV